MSYVKNLPPSVFHAFYPSKLLLLGEHTVLQGSQALAMPLYKFGGKWAISEDKTRQYNLSEFNAYLEELCKNTPIDLDTEGVSQALEGGLFFDSNIPNGYGAGSSGALVAALYDVFCRNKTNDLNEMKHLLGKMESFFHGASSGFDPLICYIKKPILIKRNKELEVVSIPKTDIHYFLIDTQITRKAANLIQIFAEKCKNDFYKEKVINNLVPHIDEAITSFLQNKTDILWSALHEISFFQYRFFPEAIPMPYQNIWVEGLSSDSYKLKLCGAGGGGFILGFCKNIEETRQKLKKSGFDILPIDFENHR